MTLAASALKKANYLYVKYSQSMNLFLFTLATVATFSYTPLTRGSNHKVNIKHT